MPRIDPFLKQLKASRGSDLHMVAGLEPRMRVRGGLEKIAGSRAFSESDLRALLREIATPAQWEHYETALELDFAYGLPGTGRFRANYFNQGSGAAAVFRLIPEQIMSLAELRMPKAVERFVHLQSGLVLITGPTGSGKSTTLAAIISAINERYDKHIVTIEDPIEFVHEDKRAIISQREVGTHTKTFETALRSAMRQNPDVLLVGELRGREAELAITAAEMGALVFGTLHTSSAAKTIDRIIDIFPVDQQEQIRTGLAEALAGVVAQILIPTKDGKGRVSAVEVLVKTTALPNIIREGNTTQLTTVMQSGKQYGMQTMDEALEAHVKEGTITAKDAYQRAADKAQFERYLDAPPDVI